MRIPVYAIGAPESRLVDQLLVVGRTEGAVLLDHAERGRVVYLRRRPAGEVLPEGGGRR